jgi:hypothetical protein
MFDLPKMWDAVALCIMLQYCGSANALLWTQRIMADFALPLISMCAAAWASTWKAT